MSHSSEFKVSCSPYWVTEAEVERHLQLCRTVFSWWAEHAVRPVTLSEFANQYKR